MNVLDILKLPVLKKAKLIAGHSGINREVQNINMMDAPDIIHFLNPNDLLVTTAYHLKDAPRSLVELIKNMAKQECAALGIKTKRFLEEIPEEVISCANKLSFPLIELPLHISLGEIVNQALSHILDMRTNELRNAIETHQKFTNHIMSGKGIKTLLENLASMIHHPILLLDQHLKLITSSHTPPDFLIDIETLHMKGYHFFLPKTTHSCFSLLSQRHPLSFFPIYTHEKRRGCLVVLGNIPVSDRAVILTIEQAANVISFELMKENALKQYSRRARNEFFINFVEGTFSSKEEIANRAKEFRLQNEQKYVCIVGKFDANDKTISFTQYQMETDIIFEFLESELLTFPSAAHFFVKGDMCILLIEVNKPQMEIDPSVLSDLKHLQTKIRNRFQRTLSFGVSNISQQFSDVQNAFKEATDALHTGQLSANTQFIQLHRTKDISEILRIVPTEDLKEFYFHTLQELSQLHHTEEQTLFHTLSIYLETHCQISETAKRLYVHRNTVIYRLEKCEELLGTSLKDPDTTLRLRLALRIKTLLNL